jgi:XRE family transcriptional regulator, aerobic/anaerobic benzoate catabolism transcriptional regulator
MAIRESASDDASGVPASDLAESVERDPFLVALGERLRSLRAQKGMTRRSLALASAVSERHLANLELGVGNASVLVLRQVAGALGCQPADLFGDDADSPEWLLIRDLLRGRDDQALRRARIALSDLFGTSVRPEARRQRIALVGLRGAGKSTLGRRLADDSGVPFVELNREIERVAGYGLGEIHNLLGPQAYRRYEKRALDETVQRYPEAVIATPGGIVSDPATFNLLLAHCFTVWLTATPADHMQRVVAQGDTRPMAGNREAMDDLKRILAGRAAFYRKADLTFDTSGRSLDECYRDLSAALSAALERPVGLGYGDMQ